MREVSALWWMSCRILENPGRTKQLLTSGYEEVLHRLNTITLSTERLLRPDGSGVERWPGRPQLLVQILQETGGKLQSAGSEEERATLNRKVVQVSWQALIYF